MSSKNLRAIRLTSKRAVLLKACLYTDLVLPAPGFNGLTMTIRTKLVLILLGFIILPMMLGIAVLFSHMQDVVRDVRVMQLENIVNLEKEWVDAFFTERKADINLFQTLTVVKDNLPIFLKYSGEKQSPPYVSAKNSLKYGEAMRVQHADTPTSCWWTQGRVILVANEAHRPVNSASRFQTSTPGPLKRRKGVYFGAYTKRNGFSMLCTAPLHDNAGNFIGEAALR
jgi:hypothetical protein